MGMLWRQTLFGIKLAVFFDMCHVGKFGRILAWLSLWMILGCGFKPSETHEFLGSFYANDCGESHGGFEWAGGYTASLNVTGTKGRLILTFDIGLGDPLEVHNFNISDFRDLGTSLSFRLEGKTARLVWVEKDAIWDGTYDAHFVGNKSDRMSEQVGHLPIEVFNGFRSHYYVELRLQAAPAGSFMLD